jgi:hypothetical protein
MTSPPTAQDTRDGRWYVDPLDGSRYPATSTILRETSSNAGIVKWSARLAAEYAVDHRAVVDAVLDTPDGRDAAVELIAKASDRYRDNLGRRGSNVHAIVEALVLDAPLPPVDDDAARLVDAFVEFFLTWHPRFELVEATVCKRGPLGWAGTLDGLAELPPLGPGLFVVDYKSGKAVRDSVPLQLTSYRYADEVWLRGAAGWEKHPLPGPIVGAVALHLTDEDDPAKGFAVVPVASGPDELEAFLHARGLYEWQQTKRRRSIGRRLRLPGESTPLADYEGAPFGRACRALERAGVTTVQALARLTVDELLALDGCGPKTAAVVADLLAEHGLELRQVAA